MSESDKLLQKTMKKLLNEKLSEAEVQSLKDEGFEFKNPTEKMYMHAVTKDPNILKDIENQTDRICYCAIAMDPETIKYVKNKTEHMCLAVVRRDGMLIKYIEDPTDIVIEDAIKENGEAINVIPREKWNFNLFIEAVKSNPFSIKYFYDAVDCLENSHIVMDFLIKSAIYLNPYVINCNFFALPEYSRYAKCAIMTDPFVYRDMQTYLRNEENDKLAVKLDARLLSDVSNYTMDTIIEAFRTNGDIAWNCWARQAYPIKFFFAHLYTKLECLHKFTHTINYKD